MNSKIKSLFLTTLIIPNLVFGIDFSAMTLNVDNLFDTYDDKNKDDKAYLPIELKQTETHINSCKRIPVQSWKYECLFLDWDEETKNKKLKNIVTEIISYDNSGPDILALQEIENEVILGELFELLEPYGYADSILIEGQDYRGIDTALISKFKINDSRLHYIKFTGEFEGKDTRPILEATLDINGKTLKVYNLHFPSGFHDVSMRIDSLNTLSRLLETHNYPSIALGDFNVNSKEDNRLNIYQSQNNWIVAHLVGCNDCKGSYYYDYGKSWDFLDTIFLSKSRGISFIPESINVLRTDTNSYSNNGKPKNFNPSKGNGVSDHLPMVAKFKLNN